MEPLMGLVIIEFPSPPLYLVTVAADLLEPPGACLNPEV